METMAHADGWRFHKRRAAGFIIPRFLSKEEKCLSSFRLPVFLYLFSAIFKSAVSFGICFT